MLLGIRATDGWDKRIQETVHTIDIHIDICFDFVDLIGEHLLTFIYFLQASLLVAALVAA